VVLAAEGISEDEILKDFKLWREGTMLAVPTV
jgi:hypothetical protein